MDGCTEPPPRWVLAYTIVLALAGALALLSAAAMHVLAVRAARPMPFRFWSIVDCGAAATLLLVAWLRGRDAPLAPEATVFGSVVLAMFFPLGTLAFVWWLVRVRPRERER